MTEITNFAQFLQGHSLGLLTTVFISVLLAWMAANMFEGR